MTIKNARKLASAALVSEDAAFFLQELSENVKTSLNTHDFNSFVPSTSPVLDVDCILCFVLQKNKTYLLLNQNEELNSQCELNFANAIFLRRTGLPVAYITGHKEFFGYDFIVSPDVLIPKPDTEILVEKAIDYIKEKVFANPNKILTICDMCTGSGCIGLSVLKNLIEENLIPQNRIPKFVLVDISSKALEIAIKNYENLIPKEYSQRVQFVQSNLFSNVTGTFDVILTNPPYIPATLVTDLLKDGRNEPTLALNGDITETGDASNSDDGLEIIRRLVPQAFEKLIYNGILLMETGEYNAEDTSELEKSIGFRNICIHKDLSGQLRVVEGIK
jgi:release factor glutamine methyltransferase